MIQILYKILQLYITKNTWKYKNKSKYKRKNYKYAHFLSSERKDNANFQLSKILNFAQLIAQIQYKKYNVLIRKACSLILTSMKNISRIVQKLEIK